MTSNWMAKAKMEALAAPPPLSARARARQILESREELLGLLRDRPESDRELSLTDLVEARNGSAAAAVSHEGRGISPSEAAPAAAAVKERRRRRSDSRSSCSGGGGGAGGVFLNFYVPGPLARSLTAPRPGRGAAGRAVAEAGKVRTEEPAKTGCWPALWGRGRSGVKSARSLASRAVKGSA